MIQGRASLKKYYEIRGQKEGHAKLVKDAKLAHAGNGAIQFTAVNCDNPHFPAYRSGHRLFQRPSPRKQIPSNNRK